MTWLEPIYSFLRSLPFWTPLAGSVACVALLWLGLRKNTAAAEGLHGVQVVNLHFEDITADPPIRAQVASRVAQVIRCHFRLKNHSPGNIAVSSLYFPAPQDIVLCNDLWGMKKHQVAEVSFHEDSLTLKNLSLIPSGKEKSFSFCLLAGKRFSPEQPFTLHMIVNRIGADTSPITLATHGGFR